MHTVWRVFCKDGREILRDRRTLFVTLLLPLLLYPVLALVVLQVVQLTRPTAEQLPAVLVDAPPLFDLGLLPPPPADGERPPPPRLRLVRMPTDERDEWAALLERTLDGQEDQPGLRREALERLRERDLVAVVRCRPRIADQPGGAWDCRWLIDDAHRHQAVVSEALVDSARTFAHHLTQRRLRDHGLAKDFADPLDIRRSGLAPAVERTRSRIAGFIPLLLVLMAISGAFHPAMDLIAGERERGTLETLLSWPGQRSHIFAGKLLVVIACALATVVLNLLSLGATGAILLAQLPPGPGGDLGLSLGPDVLVLAFVTLLPLVVTLSAVSLALGGLAASYKEAQTLLTPVLLVVGPLAALGLLPDARPSVVLDLVPVLGPVLALKEGLQEPELPWLHIIASVLTSGVLAVVVIAWTGRLLEDERFLYPAMLKAGWGRWRRWGRRPAGPGPLEALGVFAICVGAMLLGSSVLQGWPVTAQIALPLLLFILLPCLLHAWLGAYPPAGVWALRPPPGRSLLVLPLLVPVALLLSICIGQLQAPYVPATDQAARMQEQLEAVANLPLLLLCAAVVPGICEEILCRGVVLGGLRRGLGPVGAVVLSSFFFAVLHASPDRFLPQFTVGLVLGALVLRSGSLWPAILLHLGHNGLALVLDHGGWLEGLDAPAPGTWLLLASGAGAVAAILVRCSVASPSMRPADGVPGPAISAGPDGTVPIDPSPVGNSGPDATEAP